MEYKHFQGPSFITQIPTDWFISSSPEFQVIFMAPPAEDGTRANMTVSIRRLTAETTLTQLVQQSIAERQKQYTGYEAIDSLDFTETGGSGYQLVYKFRDTERNVDIYQLQALYLVDSVLFTMTGSTIGGHEDTYLPIFETIANAFRIQV